MESSTMQQGNQRFRFNMDREPFNGSAEENLKNLKIMYPDGSLNDVFYPLIRAIKEYFAFYREYAQAKMEVELQRLSGRDLESLRSNEQMISDLRVRITLLWTDISDAIRSLGEWINEVDEAATADGYDVDHSTFAPLDAVATSINSIVDTFKCELDLFDDGGWIEEGHNMPDGFPIRPSATLADSNDR